MTSVPIVNLPNLYINNMQVTIVTTTTLTVEAGQCRDSTDSYDIVLPTQTTLSTAVNGINGLDTGTIAASTWYYIFAVSDPTSNNTTGLLLSTSQTAPWIPYGYGAWRMIGVTLTDGGGDLLGMYVAGNSNMRRHFWDTTPGVLSGGTAVILTNVNLNAGVPPIDQIPVIIQVSFTPTGAGAGVSLATFGSTSTALPTINGSVAGSDVWGQLEVISTLSTTAQIQYINTAAGSADLFVASFDLFV